MEVQNNSNNLKASDLLTKQDLVEHFKRIGIQKGMLLYVQSQLEDTSYLCGGYQIVIEALQQVIGYEGTLCCEGYTPQYLDPLCKDTHPSEPYQTEVIRDALPAFDKKLSLPSHPFARQLMLFDGVYRSNHPLHSCFAWGKYAKLICDKHPLHFARGLDSPLGKLMELGGYSLLLATPYRKAHIFHMSHNASVRTPIGLYCAPIEKKVHKSFITILDYQIQELQVEGIQTMMKERQVLSETYIGRAKCSLFSCKEAYTLASAYFYTHEEEINHDHTTQ